MEGSRLFVMNPLTIARPYAVAAFDVAVEQQRVTEWQSMLTVASEVSKDQQITGLLSGRFQSSKFSEILITVCGNRIDIFCQNFIRIMAKHFRLFVLPDVVKQFIHLRTIQENIVEIGITSSDLLSDDQLARIVSVMEEKLMKKVKLTFKIDKSIIAGIILRIDNTVIDGSIRNRLKCLKDILLI